MRSESGLCCTTAVILESWAKIHRRECACICQAYQLVEPRVTYVCRFSTWAVTDTIICCRTIAKANHVHWALVQFLPPVMCAAMEVSTPFVSSVPLVFPGSNSQPEQEWPGRCFHPTPSSKVSLGRGVEEWLLKQLLPAILPCQRRLPLFPWSKRGYSCWLGGEQPAIERI